MLLWTRSTGFSVLQNSTVVYAGITVMSILKHWCFSRWSAISGILLPVLNDLPNHLDEDAFLNVFVDDAPNTMLPAKFNRNLAKFQELWTNNALFLNKNKTTFLRFHNCTNSSNFLLDINIKEEAFRSTKRRNSYDFCGKKNVIR